MPPRREGSLSAALFGGGGDGGEEVVMKKRLRQQGEDGSDRRLSVVEQGKEAGKKYIVTAGQVELVSRLAIPVGRAIPVPGTVHLSKPFDIKNPVTVGDTFFPDMRDKQWVLVEDGTSELVSTTEARRKNGNKSQSEAEVLTGPKFVGRVYRRISGVNRVLKSPDELVRKGVEILGEGANDRLMALAAATNYSSEKPTLFEIGAATRLATEVQTVDPDDHDTNLWLNEMENAGLNEILMGTGELVARKEAIHGLSEVMPKPFEMPIRDSKAGFMTVQPEDDTSVVLFNQSGSRCLRAAALGAKGFKPVYVLGGVKVTMDVGSGRVYVKEGLQNNEIADTMQDVQVDTIVSDPVEAVAAVLTKKTQVGFKFRGVFVGDSREAVAKRVGGKLPVVTENKPKGKSALQKIKEQFVLGGSKSRSLTVKESRQQKKLRLEKERKKRENQLAKSALDRLPLVGTIIVRGKLVAGLPSQIEIPVLDVAHASASILNAVGAVTDGAKMVDECTQVLNTELGPGAEKLTPDDFRGRVLQRAEDKVVERMPRRKVVITEARAMQEGVDSEYEKNILRALKTDPKFWRSGAKAFYLDSKNDSAIRKGIRQRLGLKRGEKGQEVEACLRVLKKHAAK